MTKNVNTQPDSLSGWLSYLEAIHPTNIDMGLDRVKLVYQKLNINFTNSQVILVAGTNGKGSTCRVLELLAQQAGLSTAVYGSPHISDYRERIRINGSMLSAEQHCEAFSRVNKARAETSLTYFEFGTLAAFCLIEMEQLDVVILEVGLGGRLDAVNVVEPDMSVITTIDLDHQDWLGNTREAVAFEKAGIMRSKKPCVIGELNPPTKLTEEVSRVGAEVYWQTKDFSYQLNAQGWGYTFRAGEHLSDLQLCMPGLPVQNCATAITVAHLSQWKLNDVGINAVINSASLPGRFEKVMSEPRFYLDVAHNPEATAYLANRIKSQDYDQLHLVVGMLSDKDSSNSLVQLNQLSAKWYLAPLNTPRSAKAEMLESAVNDSDAKNCFQNVTDACEMALKNAKSDDLVIGFGSFFTVSEIKQALIDLNKT